MTEKEKMLAGQLYKASDPILIAERLNARKLMKRFNDSDPEDSALRNSILKELIGKSGENFWVEPPFSCDYGYNIEIGDNVFINFNCVILDVCKVTIGDRVLIAPNVQLYTASHPLDAATRAEAGEFGKPLSIGSDVWIGGASILCPGVSIGDRAVI